MSPHFRTFEQYRACESSAQYKLLRSCNFVVFISSLARMYRGARAWRCGASTVSAWYQHGAWHHEGDAWRLLLVTSDTVIGMRIDSPLQRFRSAVRCEAEGSVKPTATRLPPPPPSPPDPLSLTTVIQYPFWAEYWFHNVERAQQKSKYCRLIPSRELSHHLHS
jgi:hypothetical protein